MSLERRSIRHFESSLLSQRKSADFKIHCRVSFGLYCEDHDGPSPSNISESRTIGAIVLGPNGNFHYGYTFMSLKTGKTLDWTIDD